jgi:fucose 4-O-acetylase-like acetyltransferase
MRTAHPSSSATGAALDIGRGLAILAVIYGHALAPWFVDAGANFSNWAFLQWKFGAAFMMPFFFFVSGLAWRAEKSLWATLRESMTLVFVALGASLALDVIVVGLSAAGFAGAAAQAPMSVADFFANAWRMVSVGDLYSLSALWFLTALAVVRLIAALCERIGAWAGVAAALALFALYWAAEAGGIRNYYQVPILWAGFAAFMAGRWSRGGFDALERRPNWALGLALPLLAITAISAGFNRGCAFEFDRWCNLAFLNDRFGVSMFMGAFGYLPLFVFTAATGIMFAAAVSIVIARRGGVVAAALKRWGRNSLNLLIVNAAFLELVNPLLAREIAPRVGGDNAIFFVILFVAAIAANVAVAGLLRPALARLRLGSHDLALFIVAALRGRARMAPPAARAA